MQKDQRPYDGKKQVIKEAFVCPCCGWDELSQRAYENLVDLPVPSDLVPPYSEYYGMPSYEVCGCCGFEFGNDDEPGTGAPITFQGYLAEWIADGIIWFRPEKKPQDWSLAEQLRLAGIPTQFQLG